jgi:hypothetical protein
VSFVIKKGQPGVEALWNDLDAKLASGSLSKDEHALFKRLVEAASLLADNPRHPGLVSHEIATLAKRCGRKVFESYLQNNAPAAGRIFWVYGPEDGMITVIGIEPHPEDAKSRGYDRVKLADMPATTQPGSKKRK